MKILIICLESSEYVMDEQTHDEMMKCYTNVRNYRDCIAWDFVVKTYSLQKIAESSLPCKDQSELF